jgi:hypothetical protein
LSGFTTTTSTAGAAGAAVFTFCRVRVIFPARVATSGFVVFMMGATGSFVTAFATAICAFVRLATGPTRTILAATAARAAGLSAGVRLMFLTRFATRLFAFVFGAARLFAFVFGTASLLAFMFGTASCLAFLLGTTGFGFVRG